MSGIYCWILRYYGAKAIESSIKISCKTQVTAGVAVFPSLIREGVEVGNKA